MEYRLPRETRLKPLGLEAAIGLRYGLVGRANAFFLSERSGEALGLEIVDGLYRYSRSIENHFAGRMQPRIGLPLEAGSARRIAEFASRVNDPRELFDRASRTLKTDLTMAERNFLSQHASEIRHGWPWWGWGVAHREFRCVAEDSVRFALGFRDRRSLNLAEVAEIALLGE